MKINVNSTLKRKEIREMLESQTKPKYTFVKMNTNVEMQFEVTDYEDFDVDMATYTKGLIKKESFGKLIVFSVLIDGQLFSGDKRYLKNTKE